MEQLQKDKEAVYLKLLHRLKEICAANDIELFLTDYTALCAARGEALTCSRVHVCVDATDAVKLAAAIEAASDSGIGVESMLNNDRYPRYELRVYDPCTIDCDPSDFFRIDNNCMNVTVELIRHLKKKQSKKDPYFIRAYRKAFGKAAYFKLISSGAANSGKMIKAGKYYFDKNTFSKSQAVTLGGEEFRIPMDKNKFFETMIGPGWEYKEVPQIKAEDMRFFNTAHGWQEWKTHVPAEDVKAYKKLYSDYQAESTEYRATKKDINKVYNTIYQAFEKIQMYKRYSDRIDELNLLRKAGDFDGLEEELLPYLRALKQYYDRGLDLFVSNELSDLVAALLEHKGNESFLNALRRIKSDTSEEVRLTDYLGNYI